MSEKDKELWQKIEKKACRSLKKSSEDETNKTKMTKNKSKVIDFDRVKDCYMINIKKNFKIDNDPRSIDAIFDTKDGRMVFVEFKNGKLSPKNVLEKLYDSVLINNDLLGISIGKLRKDGIFILVYNPGSAEELQNMVASNANESIKRMKIGRFEGYIFKKVYSFTKDQFEDWIEENGVYFPNLYKSNFSK
ncbi:hypothetical protein [Ligilactobacillus salivarius]|uniref:hypothetical protein n=1 Tax=Ligilactobacillus salivarius TaxID=1624 RepID=UPI002B45B9B7|nr:hypothetical protein [Ligilactobacillus salivarius]